MEGEPKKGKFQQLQAKIDPQLKVKWQQQQAKIRAMIKQHNDFNWVLGDLQLVAGVDISASKHDTDVACAALIVYNPKTKQVVHQQTDVFDISTQPYVPGFLAFRQIPVLSVLFNRLKQKRPQLWPQLVIVDGNGILHQNYCGLACHLGVLIGLPTIGVGKTLFYIDGLGKQKVKQQCNKDIIKAGDYSMLIGQSGAIWGAALRNSENATNPIFVSIGHKIQLKIAIECVLMLSYFRVVQPVRLADKLSREIAEHWQGNKQDLPKYPMIYLQE